MNWKRSLIVFINIFCIAFPYNIIGCGPEEDPYDSFTTFFRNDLSAAKEYRPFYYTNDLFLYNEGARDTRSDEFSEEWAVYCHNKITPQQAYRFICTSDSSAIASVVDQLQKEHPSAGDTRLSDNPMTGYLLENKNTEALQYIRFAKSTEPFKANISDSWTLPVKDSNAINQAIMQGLKGYFTTKDRFVQNRYAYQLMSLAFYNHRYADCVWYSDSLLKYTPSTKALYSAALAYKAGSLWRQNKSIEAGYTYSRAFGISNAGSVSNYMSFSWCTHRHDPAERKKLLALCRNDKEKADLLALLLLGSNAPEEAAMRNIYQLAPSAPVLEVLALREVNKIEEFYLTPQLHRQKGGLTLYFSYGQDYDPHPTENQWLQEAKKLIEFYHTVSLDDNVPNKALYETAAGYLSYIIRQYDQADAYLDRAATLPASEKLKDQQAVTRLLVTINKNPGIDTAFESRILPSVQWLEKKASADGRGMQYYGYDSWSLSLWRQFYRNVMTEVLAKRYHQQGNIYKEALCIGNGEVMNDHSVSQKHDYAPAQTNDFIHNEMSTTDLTTLDQLLRAPQKSQWDAFLCRHSGIKNDEIKATIMTAHIREYHFKEALTWLRKIKEPLLLELKRNPFGDPINDYQDSMFTFDKGRFDKLIFISTMAALMDKAGNNTATAAELYKLGVGYYNMTYYGRAWEVVKFYRPSYERPEQHTDETPFEKEYFGCFTAEKYFKAAMNGSKDKNFKARCLFMMAKCSQKQIRQLRNASGEIHMYGHNYDQFISNYMHNKYFPQLTREYGNTDFYKEAFNTCSYLRDFVGKKK